MNSFTIAETFEHARRAINEQIEALEPPTVFLLTDSNVERSVLPSLLPLDEAPLAKTIVIEPGEEHKDMRSVMKVWEFLSREGATRKSLLISIGGGMVTDLGSFAASTYRRGISFMNVSTTLLGAVDASIGGKTGVNFNGLKNEVGTFAWPTHTVVAAEAFKTLPQSELVSGFGEVLKSALLDSEKATAQAIVDLEEMQPRAELLHSCLALKSSIVERDPYEHDLRKCLNLGHTAGHAFEALSIERGKPIPHGVAVAYGLVTALVLSNMIEHFPSKWLHAVASQGVKPYFGIFPYTCDDYAALLRLMGRDKKNSVPGVTEFTLLSEPGSPLTSIPVSEDQVRAALDITRDLLL